MRNIEHSNKLSAAIADIGFTLFSSVGFAAGPDFIETDFYHVMHRATILVVTTYYRDGVPIEYDVTVEGYYIGQQKTIHTKVCRLSEQEMLGICNYAYVASYHSHSYEGVRFFVKPHRWIPKQVAWMRDLFWERFNNRYLKSITL